MTKRPTINTLTNTASPTYLTQLNQNFTNVKNQFDNTLSLDGSLPNAMNADLDLNGNDLINGGTLSADDIVIGGTSIGTQVSNAAASATSAATSASSASASATTATAYTPAYFDNFAALKADTRSWTVGQLLNTRAEGFAYQVVTSGEHVTTAGGTKLYIQLGDTGYNVKAFGAVGNGTTDDYAAVQLAASDASSISVADGDYLLSQQVTMAVPKSFVGGGATSKFRTTVGFTGPIFSIAPASGTDPKGWTVSNFEVTNYGSATNTFILDIASAGEYISKFTLSKIISNTQVSEYFVKLLNGIPNTDGLFTSVFSDNWSLGGYYLDNVGDSVILERNTTSGAGVGYYVNQLGTAANITIRDGNCTSAGGALDMVKGANLTFENMQVECPVAFTGSNNAAVSIDRPSGGSIYNTKIINNNINTQGNPLYCIYVENAVNTVIDGNELYCDVSTGAHIYIDSGARDTIIGNNKYYNQATGAEVDPIIVNNGVGNTGVWVDATLTLAGWSNQNTANEHPTGYFKDRDGNVMLRGRVAGGAIAGGETLFTLPSGYRPKTKGYLIGTYGAAGAATSVVLQIIPAGAVQILTAASTGAYLSGVVFSTK